MEATSYEEDTIFFLQIYLSEIISANPVSASETLLSETTLTWLEFAEVARGVRPTFALPRKIHLLSPSSIIIGPGWSEEDNSLTHGLSWEGLSWEDSFEEPSK